MKRLLKASLATKGLCLIIIPCILQALLLIGLALIQIETECNPLRVRQDRADGFLLNRYVIADQKLLTELDLCFLDHHVPGQSCLKAKEEFLDAAKRKIPAFRSFVDERVPILGFEVFTVDVRTAVTALWAALRPAQIVCLPWCATWKIARCLMPE